MGKGVNVVRVKGYSDVMYALKEAARQGKKIGKFVAPPEKFRDMLAHELAKDNVTATPTGRLLFGIEFEQEA